MGKTAAVAFALGFSLAMPWAPQARSQEGPKAGQKKDPSGAKQKEKDVPPALKHDDEAIAMEALALIKTRCSQCHGQGKASKAGFDALDESAVQQRVNPENPRSSEIFEKLYTQSMPKTKFKFNVPELQKIEKWIKFGAPFPKEEKRVPITESAICRLIEEDLLSLERGGAGAEDMKHQRYLTLSHLYNNPRVTAYELRLYRAALSKLLNSLTRRITADIVIPKAVDPEQTIFRIDLRRFGWSVDDWVEVLRKYPYGIEYDDNAIRAAHKRIKGRFTGTAQNPIPYIRADWFVARASLPELYYKLLFAKLPETDKELEDQLGVTVETNLKDDEVARAGFYESGVSVNNRLVERHTLGKWIGAYWKSYDFKESSGQKNLFLRPLGPKNSTALKDFDKFAFKHDGGEVIWNLPNGLQAYFLVDADKKRINTGPPEVVRDSLESAGNPLVVNGLSCIACHDRGMQRFKDAVREGFKGIEGAEKDKVEKLYPVSDDMDRLLADDEARFRAAVVRATRPFLELKPDDDVFTKYPEPISQLALRYQADMTMDDVALELGVDPGRLEVLLATNLKRLLGTLGKGRAIKREFWESKLEDEVTNAVYQEAAVQAGIAEGPITVSSAKSAAKPAAKAAAKP